MKIEISPCAGYDGVTVHYRESEQSAEQAYCSG